MKYLMKAGRPTLPSMCAPSSGSSAMARSSKSDATASCSKPQAIVNASLTAARSFPFSSSAVRTASRSPSAARNFERARKQAFTPKQLQQPPGARLEEALAHRWHHDRTGVDQQLCARRAGEPPFSLRVARVAIGARGDSQQAAVCPVVALPGQQRRVFSQQLLQAFDVVVVNGASSLRRPPTPDRCQDVCSPRR